VPDTKENKKNSENIVTRDDFTDILQEELNRIGQNEQLSESDIEYLYNVYVSDSTTRDALRTAIATFQHPLQPVVFEYFFQSNRGRIYGSGLDTHVDFILVVNKTELKWSAIRKDINCIVRSLVMETPELMWNVLSSPEQNQDYRVTWIMATGYRVTLRTVITNCRQVCIDHPSYPVLWSDIRI